jgi:hypothetical protein
MVEGRTWIAVHHGTLLCTFVHLGTPKTEFSEDCRSSGLTGREESGDEPHAAQTPEALLETFMACEPRPTVGGPVSTPFAPVFVAVVELCIISFSYT